MELMLKYSSREEASYGKETIRSRKKDIFIIPVPAYIHCFHDAHHEHESGR